MGLFILEKVYGEPFCSLIAKGYRYLLREYSTNLVSQRSIAIASKAVTQAATPYHHPKHLSATRTKKKNHLFMSIVTFIKKSQRGKNEVSIHVEVQNVA